MVIEKPEDVGPFGSRIKRQEQTLEKPNRDKAVQSELDSAFASGARAPSTDSALGKRVGAEPGGREGLLLKNLHRKMSYLKRWLRRTDQKGRRHN